MNSDERRPEDPETPAAGSSETFYGLSDFAATMHEAVEVCQECGGATRLGNGLCLSCLLRTALEEDSPAEPGGLDAALAEIPAREGEWRLGNYEVLEEIGRGGMGVIYRARQRHSRRIVALKRVLTYHGESRETLERFRREAEAAASLDHPNILPIYEVGESDGLPFFTMKFAAGGSLQKAAPALRSNPRECVRLVAKVARAVAYAHSNGILHRDLKPGNVLLDSRGEPLLTDFGLAKWVDASSDLTRSLTIFGTPGFIAPEQAHGPAAKLAPAADVYSIGAILFDLLAGRPPFLGEHALAVIREAAEKPAPRLRSLKPPLDRDLETICSRCLEREPASRYASAGALADDLDRWLEGRPILARPVSLPMQGWRWSRRNPVIAGALCACLVLAGIVVGRQIRNQHLQAALNAEQLAAHSVAVLPFLNLDTGRPDAGASRTAATVLNAQVRKIGLGKVEPLAESPPRWTGAGTEEEVEEAAKRTGNRNVLSGTMRKLPNGGRRYSIHLFRPAGNQLLASWSFETGDGDSPADALAKQRIAAIAYPLLSSSNAHRAGPAIDPAMKSDRARPFMISGRDFLVRRTIPDLDRAIACFEGAVREAPQSVSARSFLAMAYMGRNILSASPEFAAKARQNARAAVELAPHDPTSHRAYAMICITQGRYAEGQEHAFQALELGDQSERVFGHVGYSWKLRGHPERAIVWYQKARISQRQPADYEALLGDCFADLGLDDAARSEYEAAAVYQPNQPDAWMGFCYLKLLAGDVEGARQIYQAELPKHPGSPSAEQMGALIEFFGRDFVEAEKRYSELAASNPTGGGQDGFRCAVDYATALARMKIERGDRDGARALLASRIEAEETRRAEVGATPDSLYRQAAAEALIGDSDRAIEHLRGAIDAGWIDYRSTRLDPRFDSISGSRAFQELLATVSQRVAALRSQVAAN